MAIDLEKMKRHHVDTMKDQTVGELIEALEEAKEIIYKYVNYPKLNNKGKAWLSKFKPRDEK